jgi:catechol 2,3-dioxygenase-like lactoylglutathione lyase family enzyme
MAVPDDVHRLPIVLVLEVDDARAVRRRLETEDVTFLAEPWEAPWGGVRFYVVDPDGYLVEIEQLG